MKIVIDGQQSELSMKAWNIITNGLNQLPNAGDITLTGFVIIGEERVQPEIYISEPYTHK